MNTFSWGIVCQGLSVDSKEESEPVDGVFMFVMNNLGPLKNQEPLGWVSLDHVATFPVAGNGYPSHTTC